MNLQPLSNTHVESYKNLPSPKQIQEAFPITTASGEVVLEGRKIVQDILDGKDKRIFIVLGPCSIHDTKAALEYAEKLKELNKQVKDKFFLMMRVYFEKPRTTVGWKGLINDPFMDDSFQIEEGLKIARQLLLQITSMGLATATEALDPISPQYLSDLISWSAIGARTTESQTHREMASGLSTPVGFKNGTDGNIQVAIDAMKSALSSHHFLGIDQEGKVSVFKTKGNPYSHVVLRGANQKTNYDIQSIQACEAALAKAGLRQKIMVDCSHGNSNKNPKKQPDVFSACIAQKLSGNQSIVGMMVESHLHEGNQSIPKNLSELKYGVSVTDACLNFDDTKQMILNAYEQL